MHPAALVLPASDNTTVHDSSLIIRSKIMEAAASSLALKDILLMDSISPTALKPAISICSIGSVKRFSKGFCPSSDVKLSFRSGYFYQAFHRYQIATKTWCSVAAYVQSDRTMRGRLQYSTCPDRSFYPLARLLHRSWHLSKFHPDSDSHCYLSMVFAPAHH